MIDKESPAGSWKQAIERMRQVKNDAPVADRPNADDYRNRAERAEAECQELQEQVDILMEKCRQWKQSTEMLCAIPSDNITLGDLYRAGVTVSFSVE
jgi:hypothetical protein